MTSSSREDTVSPSSSNTDRRDPDNDLEDDDCLSDLDSEISDPAQVDDIDPVSDTTRSSPPPQPNLLITNNPFLPPHLQHPVKMDRASSFDLVRPPLPPHPHPQPPPHLTQSSSSSSATSTPSASSNNPASSSGDNPRESEPRQPSTALTATPHTQRPLFKPHEMASSPDRTSAAVIRPEPQQPRQCPDRSPHGDLSPGAEFVKRELPHPAFTPHHEMLSHFAAARAEFLHRDVTPRDYSTREKGVPVEFHPRDLRVDFSKAHELMRQEYGKQHEQFSQESMNGYSRHNGVLGSAS